MLKKLSVAVAAALLASCAVPTSQHKTAGSADGQYETSDAPIQDKAATAQQVANALLKHNSPLHPDAKLAQYDNLWQRIADQMTLTVPDNDDIESQKRFFIRNQKALAPPQLRHNLGRCLRIDCKTFPPKPLCHNLFESEIT